MHMKWLIAGGGTGGHLFPGIALAEEVLTRHSQNQVFFVGTSQGIEARVLPQEGYRLEVIEVSGLKGKGLKRMARSLLQIPKALYQSWQLLRREKPQMVVGVGGYASGPVVLMASLMGIRTAVQEQNAVPGFTNRVLGRFVDSVFVAFKEAKSYFPQKKVHLLGNPIRRALLDNYLRPKIPSPRFTLLITGGSQGAHRLNWCVAEALGELGDFAKGFSIIHQTGKNDHQAITKRYDELGLDAEVHAFIEDMPKAYARADLIVCRAGAATLAEIAVARKASILVPFPYAADNHQEVNARSMVDAGAAVLAREAELSGSDLAALIRELHDDGERREAMERASGLLGRPEAAREIADVCVGLVFPQGRGPT